MTKNFKLYLDGFELSSSIEIEDSEIEGMTESEVNDYIFNSAWEYVKESMEIIIEED